MPDPSPPTEDPSPPAEDPNPLAEAEPRRRFFVKACAVLLALLPLLLLFGAAALAGLAAPGLAALIVLGAPLVYGALKLVEKTGAKGDRYVLHVLSSILILVVFPLFGLLVDAAADECVSTCKPNFRPLAMPEVFGLVPLHAAAAFAFFLSLRRPSALTPRVEAAIVCSLSIGVVLHVLLAVQFFVALPVTLYIIPLPLLTPFLTVPLLLRELVRRLRARGHDALALEAARARERERGYREHAAPRPATITRSPIHVGLLARGLARVPFVLGLHAVVMGVVFQSKTGGIDAFLRTCGYAFSRVPIPPSADCHYLCTIAAQGSPTLVRPYRWGVRRGRPILVNRQLALANAFEDLLHERWPRFGRLARRLYDALALPISGALSRRWIANALYLLMKPAEALFLVALLFLDPGDPESRIDRMYR